MEYDNLTLRRTDWCYQALREYTADANTDGTHVYPRDFGGEAMEPMYSIRRVCTQEYMLGFGWPDRRAILDEYVHMEGVYFDD